MQEKSAIWATPTPLLIGLYAKNRRGGHNVPPPLSNRVKLNSLFPPPTLNIQHKINGCVAVRTTTPAQLSPGFGDYHNPGKLDALYENSLGFSAF